MIVARTWKRIFAYGIDMFFLAPCWWPVFLFPFLSMASFHEAKIPVNIVILSISLMLFYKWMFLYFLGATPGKLVMGLRVVNRWDSAKPLTLLQSLLRVMADGFSFFFGSTPRALAFYRFDRTHLSDWIAETQVVQKVEHRSIRRRWWVITVLIIYLVGPGNFERAYRLIGNIQFENGYIVVSADYWMDQ